MESPTTSDLRLCNENSSKTQDNNDSFILPVKKPRPASCRTDPPSEARTKDLNDDDNDPVVRCGEPHLSLYGQPFYYTAEDSNEQTLLQLEYQRSGAARPRRKKPCLKRKKGFVDDGHMPLLDTFSEDWVPDIIMDDREDSWDSWDMDTIQFLASGTAAVTTKPMEERRAQLKSEENSEEEENKKKLTRKINRNPRGKDLMRLVHRRNQELDDKEMAIELKMKELEDRESAVESKSKKLLGELTKEDAAIRRKRRKLTTKENAEAERMRSLKLYESRLFQKHQEQQQVNDCFICFEAPIDCILVPCGHMVACMECATKFKKNICCFCNQRSKPQKIYRA